MFTHALGVLFQKETRTQFGFVPYRGEGSAVQDLVAGHIDLMWGSPTSFVHVQSGGIKACMVTARNRLSIAPDIPTAAEVGLPALTFSPWWVELALLPFALVSVPILRWCYKKYRIESCPSGEVSGDTVELQVREEGGRP